MYRLTSKTGLLFKGFATLFFCGPFMFGHFLGIMALFSVVPGGDGWTGLSLFEQSSTQLFIMFITLMISHGYSFFYNFIGKNEKTSVAELVRQFGAYSPEVEEMVVGDFFSRIFFTQLIVIIGGIIIVLTKSTIYLSAIFIIAKMITDLIFHRKKHKINNNLLSQID